VFDLVDFGKPVLQQLPLLNIKIEDIRIDIEPSEHFPFPVIHIDAKLEIRLGF
jgi:hypothetical protein